METDTLTQHLYELADAFSVSLVIEGDLYGGSTDMSEPDPAAAIEVTAPGADTPAAYAISLHEFGHAAAIRDGEPNHLSPRDGFALFMGIADEQTLEGEAIAWDWAIRNARTELDWARVLEALESYREGSTRDILSRAPRFRAVYSEVERRTA